MKPFKHSIRKHPSSVDWETRTRMIREQFGTSGTVLRFRPLYGDAVVRNGCYATEPASTCY